MGQNGLYLRRDTLADLILALLQWRGRNLRVKDVHIQIKPAARPGEHYNSLYIAHIEYLEA